MAFFEYSRLWIFGILWMFKYSRLWWSHPCHWCCSLKYLHLWIAWYGKQCTHYHVLCFFLTLLFTFWQKYKSCTSTSGSIISYQVRCKCVTLWQVGPIWSQNVSNLFGNWALQFILLSSKFQQNAHFIWNENFPLPELCVKKEWRYYRLLCQCNN